MDTGAGSKEALREAPWVAVAARAQRVVVVLVGVVRENCPGVAVIEVVIMVAKAIQVVSMVVAAQELVVKVEEAMEMVHWVEARMAAV